jgi:hypothetical protein
MADPLGEALDGGVMALPDGAGDPRAVAGAGESGAGEVERRHRRGAGQQRAAVDGEARHQSAIATVLSSV